MNLSLLLIAGAMIFTVAMLARLVQLFLVPRAEGDRLELLGDELREIEELVARRQVIVATLRELAFERECDKLPQEDYDRLKRRYELEAVRIMRRLDEIHGGRGWEAAIDAELDRRMSATAEAAPPAPEPAGEPAEPREEPAASPAPPAEATGDGASSSVEAPAVAPATIDCPSCDKSMEADARFCSGCGHRLDDLGEAPALPPSAAATTTAALADDAPPPAAAMSRGENAR